MCKPIFYKARSCLFLFLPLSSQQAQIPLFLNLLFPWRQGRGWTTGCYSPAVNQTALGQRCLVKTPQYTPALIPDLGSLMRWTASPCSRKRLGGMMRRVLLETWKPEQTSSNFQLTTSPAPCPVGDPGHLSRHSTHPLLGYGGQTSSQS